MLPTGLFFSIIQYKISKKMKMLQEYWASTVIFIGFFSLCGVKPPFLRKIQNYVKSGRFDGIFITSILNVLEK